jgi:hypothetical protein
MMTEKEVFMIHKMRNYPLLFTVFSLTLFMLGGCKDPAEDSPGDSATDSVPILQDSDSSKGSDSMTADVDTADTSDSADSGTGNEDTGISNETDSSLPHETPLTVGALILYLNKLCVFDFSVITDCETPPALVGGWTESGEDWTSTLTLKNDGTYTDVFTADGDTPETGSGNWCYSVDGLYTLSSVQSDGLIDNELNPVHVVENRLYWGLKTNSHWHWWRRSNLVCDFGRMRKQRCNASIANRVVDCSNAC